MPPLELRRALEERFGCHRKELRGILRAVRVEQGGLARIGRAPQRLELIAHYLRPRPYLRAAVERRRAVRAAVLEIELMGELVQDEVVSVARIGGPSPDLVPGEYDCAQVPLRVAEYDSSPSVQIPPSSRVVSLATY